MLVVLLDRYIPTYHSSTLYGLRVDAACFEILMKKKLPRNVYNKFKEFGPLTFITRWFLTLYSMALPWNTCLRTWDMFLHDGPKALFRAGICILKTHGNSIAKNGSSEILSVILDMPKEFTDSEQFIRDCLKIR